METASNPFDELTSLYLGEVETEAEDETTAGAADASREDSDRSMVVPGRHAVTIALCGHLPVMAGLWVTQYADRLAAEVGPTGLVRLEGGRCILEVLRPGAELAERIESRPQGDLVEQVSQLASSGIRRWIVCVDDRDAASAVRAGADEVVILTAPDKPAVIEAFRLAKTASARVVDPSLLDLGLVLVGTDDEWADALANRLSRVSSRMLDRELPVRGTVKRIDVVEGSVRRMFAEAARAPVDEVVESIIESLSVAEAAELEVGDRRSSRPVEDEPPSLRLADEFGGHPVGPIRIAPAAATASEPSDAESVPASFPTPTPTPASTPVPAPEPEVVSNHAPSAPSVGADDWARSLGLEPIHWSIPAASSVRFAADESGRLHLLASDRETSSLQVASSWIRAQRDAFGRATGLDPEKACDPELHVVTDHPPRVADMHRCGWRLHLAVVQADGSSRMVPLNDDSNRSMPV